LCLKKSFLCCNQASASTHRKWRDHQSTVSFTICYCCQNTAAAIQLRTEINVSQVFGIAIFGHVPQNIFFYLPWIILKEYPSFSDGIDRNQILLLSLPCRVMHALKTHFFFPGRRNSKLASAEGASGENFADLGDINAKKAPNTGLVSLSKSKS